MSRPARFLLDLWALARPWFWPVSLLPFYVGFVLATHRLRPVAADLPALLVGAVVVEPLVWLAVLAVNDAHDLPGDLVNPRKAGTPLTSGRLSVRDVHRIALGAAGIALLASLWVSRAFAAGALLALALGWLYSTPPVRLKARPGADVTANAVALAAALYVTNDGGQKWTELTALRTHPTGPQWQPGAGGMCLHTIILDPVDRNRIYVAISAAGAFRSDDGGARWRPVSGDLPSDFGFPIAVHAHEPETIYVVPITSDSLHYPPEGKLRVYRSRTGGGDWEPLTDGLPQSDCYVNVYRDAMAVDTLDPCGVYFGTTGGQVYRSADGGDTWAPIVRDLPAVLSVEVQVLP